MCDIISYPNEVVCEELAGRHNEAFPKYPPLIHKKGWLYGMWMIGNDYRNKSNFYGAYPPNILKRYDAMFNWADGNALHLFSGSLGASEKYTRFDLVTDTDIRGDAHLLGDHFDNEFFVIYADPPYTKGDAEKYGTKMINRKRVLHECYKALIPGGFLVWLDQTLPMYRKIEYKLIGTIGVIRSTNHRTRTVFIFRKVGIL